MKLPEKIKGRNRIRDAAVVVLYKRAGLQVPELAEKFNLTQRRIHQILAKNHAFIKRDKAWEKEKRINRLIKRLNESAPTKKDELEIMAELRKEIEGEDAKKDAGESKIIVIYPPKGKDNGANRVETIPSAIPAS